MHTNYYTEEVRKIFFPNIDGERATTEVINNFLNIGIQDLSEIKEALLGKENELYEVLSWVLKIERSEWELKDFKMSRENINKIYKEAIDWATNLMESNEGASSKKC